MNAIERSLFSSRIQAICDEMGAVLLQSSISPNIKDRLDFSCAIFDPTGQLCAQAAHIPVHLGSMAYAMQSIVDAVDWCEGDSIILNDPYLGGTHLPDITVIEPVFSDSVLLGFVANRAHHADIGASQPGSMPLSHTLQEEGLIIPPTKIVATGKLNQEFLQALTDTLNSADDALPDILAQLSANHAGRDRLLSLIETTSIEVYIATLNEIHEQAEQLAIHALKKLPSGYYEFTDVMDDDGMGHVDIAIKTGIHIDQGQINIDFTGTHAQVPGNINCPLSVTAAAVYYVFYCLMPAETPASSGAFKPIHITAPEGCLLNAQYPSAVAAGNVETSTRIVDVLLGALAKAIPDAIPAASHGSMNNVAMGNTGWDYYETLGGGMGAHHSGCGISAVQTHMTNTCNTPIEILEMNYPLFIEEYSIRKNSGGNGLHRGGDGLIREYRFLDDTRFTLLTERRRNPAWGLHQGESGKPGSNQLNGEALPGKVCIQAKSGDRLRCETPGGGGWGKAD